MGFFSSNKDMGIDLGTANTLVFVKGKGIVLSEPSVVAINSNTRKPLAVGQEAKLMIGRTPGNIVAIRPLKDGVIADFDVAQTMLKKLIEKVTSKSAFTSPRIIVCYPSGVTEVEKRAVEDATNIAGAREVYIIEESMASAVGAGLPVVDPFGNMVLDIGGGTSEVAVISLGAIVTAKTVRVAGDAFDEAIINYVKKNHNLHIGDRTAEAVKISIGSVYPCEDLPAEMDVKGRDLVSGLPRNVVITAEEVREALSEPIKIVVDAVKETLENTPPELSADIVEKGIILTGGGALLKGLDRLLSAETMLPVRIADNPLDCVVLGAGILLEEIETLKLINNDSKRKPYRR